MTMPIHAPTPARRVNLCKLMRSGYSGLTLIGKSPETVIRALGRRFDVVTRHIPGVYDQEIRCYDEHTGLRLRVQYRKDRFYGWQYNPVAVHRRDRH